MFFDEPTAAEAAFYDAFRALDPSRMRAVWADSANTSCIHPGGDLIRGTPDILASWQGIFRGTEPPRVEYRLVSANVDERLAVHTVQEQIHSASGRHALVLATNIYGRTGSGWQMLAHHASLPLVESSASGSVRVPLH